MKESQRAYKIVPTLLEKTRHDSAALIKKSGVEALERSEIKNFPNVSEFEVVRHYTNLSRLNFSIDEGFYPLGSCTMKYNPKVNDVIASEDNFQVHHPYAPEFLSQGSLEVMFKLQEALCGITGMAACSLHPAAGAHGEFAGVKMIAAYHKARNDMKRDTILVPDSAHGTNPASAALCGLKVKEVKTGPNGYIEAAQIAELIDETTAGLMVTIPNTLGVFEQDIYKISQLLHEKGGLLYCDGANLNALVGQLDFGQLGVDVMHINLHKTFSTPHGGGGPGAGPVVVSERLRSFLPSKYVVKTAEGYRFERAEQSIGDLRIFWGNFGMLVRALAYIYAYGEEDLAQISETAVLNANYIRHQLQSAYYLPFKTDCLHEVIFSDKWQKKEADISTKDIAKRIMDFDLHPPTVYFPLVVDGAIMIEPTETESKPSLDHFIEAMLTIAKEVKDSPERVKNAPHCLGIGKVDETRAARQLKVTWSDLA